MRGHRVGNMLPPALMETTTRDYYRNTEPERLLLIRQNARKMLDAGVDPELVARLYPEHGRGRPRSRA